LVHICAILLFPSNRHSRVPMFPLSRYIDVPLGRLTVYLSCFLLLVLVMRFCAR